MVSAWLTLLLCPDTVERMRETESSGGSSYKDTKPITGALTL